MKSRLAVVALAAVLGAAPAAAWPKGSPKSGAKKEPQQAGVQKIEVDVGGVTYLQVAVPKGYDGSRWYPLLFVLAAGPESVDAWVAALDETVAARGWLVACPSMPTYDNIESVEPLKRALEEVQRRFRVDDRRTVLAGDSAGANMAWCLAIAEPKPWAGFLMTSGEIPQQAMGGLKAVAGKPVYLFRGELSTNYTKEHLERDAKLLEGMKSKVVTETKPSWNLDFPHTSMPAIGDWLDSIWPPGAYRDKAALVEDALEKKDIPGAVAALKELQAELKRSPYPAFEAKAVGYEKAVADLARALVKEAKDMLAVDPLVAVERMEAAVKAAKGIAPVDREAAKALEDLRKDPAVVNAKKAKEAETQAAAYFDKGAAAEAKADAAKALEWYRKVVALGDTSKKDEAEKRIAELERTVGGK